MKKWIQRNYLLLLIASSILTIAMLSPFYPLIVALFSNNSESWQHIKDNLLLGYLTGTVILAFRVLIYCLLFGIIPAYFLSFYRIPFSKLFRVLFLLPLAIPSYIMAYTYGDLFSFTGDFYNFLELFSINRKDIYFNFLNDEMLYLLLSFSLFPYIYISSLTYFSRIPNEITMSARSLGKSELNIFVKLILPLSRPAIVAASFLVIMEILNDYGAVKYFGFNTLTTGVFRAWLGMGEINAALKLSAYFLVIIFILIYLEKRLRKGAFSARQKSIGEKQYLTLNFKSKVLVVSTFVLFLFFQLFLPIIKIVKNALSTDFDYAELLEISLNTISIAFFASLAIVLISFILNSNYLINRGRFSNLLLSISNLGYSVPGAIIAVGVIAIFLDFSLPTVSITLLFSAYIIRFFAVGNSQLESGFISSGEIFWKSALSLGKSPSNALKNIHTPLMSKFIMAGLVITVVDIIKELPLTLILRPFNYDTLATRTFDYAADELLTKASLPALMIILISLVPILFLRNINK